MGSPRGLSRRSLLVSGLGAASLWGQGGKGTVFPPDSRRYADPATELDVFRLTDPSYTAVLPAPYNRTIARNSSWMIFSCDRTGSQQAFHLDLKTAQTRQLTDVEDLDPASLTLTPDNRTCCFFAGRSLHAVVVASLRERQLYTIPEGCDRLPGFSVGPDGTHAAFCESHPKGFRLRMVSLRQGAARTVVEAPFPMTDPIARPMRAQILYRQADQALWLVNSDGQQNRKLRIAPGRIGPADWAPDGKTLLYLIYPEDRKELNAIREHTPDTNTDKLVAKTSQFVSFGFNSDTSVFVGASRNAGSPDLLLLLRITRRELTLCEHKTSRPELVAPRFSHDSQRVYFQSDRHGKLAIYDMHVEKLVEKTDDEG
jgi:oligogalacturonide lyase